MKQKQFWFLRIPVLFSALLCAVTGASIFYAMRNFWVFYDPNMIFLGGSMGVFLLAIATIALLLALAVLRLYVPKWKSDAAVFPKAMRICAVVGFVLAALAFIGGIVILCASGAEPFSDFLLYLKKDLPYLGAFLAGAALLLLLPLLSGKGKAVLAGALALCIALASLGSIFPFRAFRFVAAPVVMDTGKDYAVVFATSDKGTGYVEYTYQGREYTLYAEAHGRRIGDRHIHAVHIPYEHLNNNPYTIGSTRVVENFGYGSRLGKTISAGPYTLKVNTGKTQSYLCISDWHTQLKKAKAAIAQLGDYDALIMLGDPAGDMSFEEQAVRYIVQFGGEITGGTMPVIFVRGNHETRGAFAADLPAYLGYERLYYTVQRGAYSFLVLDSGEDKPDDHVEYGGLDDYARQRAAMLEWLQTRPKTGDKLVVLSHAWQVCEPETETKQSLAAWNEMDRLGARFLISGHTHVCEFLNRENTQAAPYLAAHPSITAYIDGGIQSNKNYIASKLTLSPTGVHFEAADNTGEKVMDTTLPWHP